MVNLPYPLDLFCHINTIFTWWYIFVHISTKNSRIHLSSSLQYSLQPHNVNWISLFHVCMISNSKPFQNFYLDNFLTYKFYVLHIVFKIKQSYNNLLSIQHQEGTCTIKCINMYIFSFMICNMKRKNPWRKSRL